RYAGQPARAGGRTLRGAPVGCAPVGGAAVGGASVRGGIDTDTGDRLDRAVVRGGHVTSSRWVRMTSARSTVENGRPRTDVWGRTSARNSARSSIESWPRFISGTTTRS